MHNFVSSGGKCNIDTDLLNKKPTNLVDTLKGKDANQLTGKQKMALKKEMRARQEFETMKQAAIQAKINNSHARDMLQQQFHGDGTGAHVNTVSSFGGGLTNQLESTVVQDPRTKMLKPGTQISGFMQQTQS